MVFDDDLLVASDEHPHARFAVDVELTEQAAFRVVGGYEGSFEALGGADMYIAVGVRQYDRAEMNRAGQRQRVCRRQYRVRDVSAADFRCGCRCARGIGFFSEGDDRGQNRD